MPATPPSSSLLRKGEHALSNAVVADTALTICVPTWRDDASALLRRLKGLSDVEQCSLLIFDDGSADPILTGKIAEHVLAFPGPARLVTARQNAGRSAARNRLLALSETDWLLFLDADMLPDETDFLARYLAAAHACERPNLLVGGFSLTQVEVSPETRLHAAQASKSECLPAAARAKSPGRFVFSSNILVHRDILKAAAFDPAFTGWGWEDVDWGLRVAEQFDVRHIDNTATHLGLDTDTDLLKKYSGSGPNFGLALAHHRETLTQTPIYKAAALLRRMPARPAIRSIARALATSRALPVSLRLLALKTYRAAIYAEHLS